jgi:hypothetical protein
MNCISKMIFILAKKWYKYISLTTEIIVRVFIDRRYFKLMPPEARTEWTIYCIYLSSSFWYSTTKRRFRARQSVVDPKFSLDIGVCGGRRSILISPKVPALQNENNTNSINKNSNRQFVAYSEYELLIRCDCQPSINIV